MEPQSGNWLGVTVKSSLSVCTLDFAEVARWISILALLTQLVIH